MTGDLTNRAIVNTARHAFRQAPKIFWLSLGSNTATLTILSTFSHGGRCPFSVREAQRSNSLKVSRLRTAFRFSLILQGDRHGRDSTQVGYLTSWVSKFGIGKQTGGRQA